MSYTPTPLPEHTCPVCGKLFICQNAEEWVYKKQWYNKKYLCCSWSCYRKINNEMEAKRSKRGRKKKIDICEV